MDYENKPIALHAPNYYVNCRNYLLRSLAQILRELRANLTRDEISNLFRLLNRHPEHVEISWSKVEISLIRKYQHLGCKLGDATVAAHVETLGVQVLVSENRDFLTEIQGLPFQVLSAEKMWQTLKSEG